jgi:membrane-bound metal-dependent hydrolase YbcI (DUF457 family)
VCSSPTHDAVGAFGGLLALSLLYDDAINPTGLLVLVGCTVVMGLAETRASLRCRREEEPLKVPRAAYRSELKLKGMERDEINVLVAQRFPRPHWHGPAKQTRRKLRTVALVGAMLSAWPVAISYALSRLPDQTEVARIDHRKITHWAVSAVALLVGVWFGLREAGVDWDVVSAVVLFAGIGIAGHLLADMLTLAGVPLLGPFWRRDLHLLPRGLRVRTGGIADALVMLAANAGTVWLAITMGGWA